MSDEREKLIEKAMPELSDDQKERIAIEVEHLPPDEAQAEYERRVREAEKS